MFIFQLIRFIFRFMFHCNMFLFALFLPFCLLMTLADVFTIVENGVPTANQMPMFFYGIVAFWLYLAMRRKSLQRFYARIPVFIPLMQMSLITAGLLNLGVTILNKWADQALYSKGVAVLLLILCLLIGRLAMSWWYSKYPISDRAQWYKEMESASQ